MSEFKASGFRDEFGNAGPDLVGITTLTSPYYFVPPSGSTAQRPQSPPPGMLRFNTDIGRLEVWRNDHWGAIVGESPNLGNQNAASGESAGGTGTRGVFGGNRNTPTITSSNESSYITIETLGDAIDFGNLTLTIAIQGSCSSRTRGIFFGGYCHPNPGTGGSRTNKINGWTFASTGSHVDFSSTMSQTAQQCAGTSSSTRGILQFGFTTTPSPVATVDTLEYITIASVGNSVDFGDLTRPKSEIASFSSGTRGVFAGGYFTSSPFRTDDIDYVTISTLGNAQDFGDLTIPERQASGGGNSTRGIIMGGIDPSALNTIQFITIASKGDSQDFGDLLDTVTAGSQGNSVSNPNRSIYAGGITPAGSDVIQYITNQTTGNAIDFGDLIGVRIQFAGASNGHGGL